MSAEFVRPPQIARLLGVAKQTVHLWVRTGRLSASNIAQPGRQPRWIVKTDDLQAFLASCKQPADPVA